MPCPYRQLLAYDNCSNACPTDYIRTCFLYTVTVLSRVYFSGACAFHVFLYLLSWSAVRVSEATIEWGKSHGCIPSTQPTEKGPNMATRHLRHVGMRSLFWCRSRSVMFFYGSHAVQGNVTRASRCGVTIMPLDWNNKVPIIPNLDQHRLYIDTFRRSKSKRYSSCR